jgi:ADP-ribosylglycohydrolase
MLANDHTSRLERARLSLEGLSVGDAFGQRYFGDIGVAFGRIERRQLAPAPWAVTDDTEMSIAIYDVLSRKGQIDRDLLANAFLRRYQHDPRRGYGAGAHSLLEGLVMGLPWHLAAPQLFSGQGSKGNGGGMRSAPIGAYFADDLDALVANARASAEVTHAHPDGQAGAIAIALGAAYACLHRAQDERVRSQTLLQFVLERVPSGETQQMLVRANGLPTGSSMELAASALGTGDQVLSSDTIPFALWCAQQHLEQFEEALWLTVSGLGDRDTTCAMVGGIVVCTGASIPAEWLACREALRFDEGLS